MCIYFYIIFFLSIPLIVVLLHFSCKLSAFWEIFLYYLFYVTDIIFLIYVYQRYIYPVDKRRVNEYGTSQEMLEDDSMQNGTAPATAAIEPAPEAAAVPDSPPKTKTNSPNPKKSKNKKAKKND